jgi:2-dehydro-3-deoxygluconokinase
MQAQQRESDVLAADWFYFSGISLAILSPTDREQLFALLSQLKARGCRLVFDPNYRAALWPSSEQAIEAFIRAYRLADVALPGLDDHRLLFGDSTQQAVLNRLQQYGVAEIVVKNGKEGALAAVAGEQFHCPAVMVKKVVDTTAAGDSFNGAYLAARLQGLSAPQACQYAAQLAAFVVEHTGAIVSAPNFAEFQQRHPL